MPILSNTRHEAFAQALAQGMSQEAAYAKAGYKPHRENASRLISNDNVAARVRELQEQAARKHEVTVDSLTSELDAALEGAMADAAFSAAVAAVMGKAKLHGLIVDRAVNQNQNATIETTPMTKEEWLAEHSAPGEAQAQNGHLETAGRPPARTH